MSDMVNIVEQLEAAKVLGFSYILYQNEEPHSLYFTGDAAQEVMEELDQAGAEHGSLEIVYVNTGDVYSSNALPEDEEDEEGED